jgi:hypothetical protein
MDLCADLTEKNTKRLKFKVFFSIVMTIISLMIYPQASWINPYQVLTPPDNDANISIYLVVESYGAAQGDLDDIDDTGVETVIIMPDMTAMNATVLKNITQYASGLGFEVGISLGGTILSSEEYMSSSYQDDARDAVADIVNESVLDYVDIVEIFPYLNAPEDYGIASENIFEYMFGPLGDDLQLLEELLGDISGYDVTTRTSVHMTYSTSFRVVLKNLGEIDDLDQVGVNFFQSHINSVPTAISSAIEFAQQLSGKEVVVGAIGYSTHDDAHNQVMQDEWFWACADVVNSFNIKEMALWQWNDRETFPFIVPEIIEPKYGISGKSIASSVSNYIAGNLNYAGYAVNWIEVILGTFSTSGSTGIISGNILFSLVLRILLGILIGRKCKLNGTLIATLLFAGTLIFHFSLGVPITNSPSWWVAFFTYFYLYASISAGVYQIQVVSTVVRHKKVFGFCDSKDANSCATEFMQNKTNLLARPWRPSDAFL